MHTFNVGCRVRHVDNDVQGTIVALTTLDEVTEGCCDEDEKDEPWYAIQWDHEEFIGNEAEGSLDKI